MCTLNVYKYMYYFNLDKQTKNNVQPNVYKYYFYSDKQTKNNVDHVHNPQLIRL